MAKPNPPSALDKAPPASVLAATKPGAKAPPSSLDRPHENQYFSNRSAKTTPFATPTTTQSRAHRHRSPLENSSPKTLQVMFSGTVGGMRAIESNLRAADFAGAIAFAVTLYEPRDFAMIDVLPADCTTGPLPRRVGRPARTRAKRNSRVSSSQRSRKCSRSPDPRRHG